MAKKIRFSLEMEHGVMVGDVEALRDNFSLPQVLMYFTNGKLLIWLRDRYENDLADAVEALGKDDPQLGKKISDIFGVEYDESAMIDMEKAAERDAKLKQLKEHTTEQRFIDHVDQVAFTQDDLYDLLDEDEKEIYLCGEQFTIPLAKKGIHYIGVNRPVAVINAKTVVDWKEKGIELTDVTYDEKYQEIERDLSPAIKNASLQYGKEDYCQVLFTESPVANDPLADKIRERFCKNIYLVKGVFAEKVVAAKEYDGRIYYIIKDEDGCGRLHIFDTFTQKEDILDGKIENIEWESKNYDAVWGCTDRWFVYKPKYHAGDERIYVFDVKKNQMKTTSGLWNIEKGNRMVVGQYLYIFQSSMLYKIDLNTMEKSSVFSEDYKGTVLGNLINDNGSLLLFYQHGEETARFYRIDCKTDKVLDYSEIEETAKNWKSMLLYKNKIYYVKLWQSDSNFYSSSLYSYRSPKPIKRIFRVCCFDLKNHKCTELDKFQWNQEFSSVSTPELEIEKGFLCLKYNSEDIYFKKSIIAVE